MTVGTKQCGCKLQGQSSWRYLLDGKLVVVYELPKKLWGLNTSVTSSVTYTAVQKFGVHPSILSHPIQNEIL